MDKDKNVDSRLHIVRMVLAICGNPIDKNISIKWQIYNFILVTCAILIVLSSIVEAIIKFDNKEYVMVVIRPILAAINVLWGQFFLR